MGKSEILITGGTGLLGKGMIETSPQGCQILSVHIRPYLIQDPNAIHSILDLRDPQAVNRLFESHDIDTVIHAAGIANVDYVEKHVPESIESNVTVTRHIASACRRKGAHLIYVSTNAVFDGTSAPYAESQPVCPINQYGRLKAECEKLVAETLSDYTIVRPILMYGWNHPTGRSNPVSWIVEKLSRGETIQMVNDVYENPLYNIQCGQILWEIVKRKPSGIFHLAGADILNRYEFALRVAKIFGLDSSLIQEKDSSFFPAIAPRPKNTSFITARVEKELGIAPLKIESGLEHMKKSRKNDEETRS